MPRSFNTEYTLYSPPRQYDTMPNNQQPISYPTNHRAAESRYFLSLSTGQKKALGQLGERYLKESYGLRDTIVEYLLSYTESEVASAEIPTDLVRYMLITKSNWELGQIRAEAPTQTINRMRGRPMPNIEELSRPIPPRPSFLGDSAVRERISEDTPAPEDEDDDSPESTPRPEITVHDLNVWYEGTFGTKDGGVVFLKEFFGNNKVLFYPLDSNGNNLRSQEVSFTSDFDMSLPKLGYINTEKSTVFVAREHRKGSPSRYRRGLRSDTVSIFDMSDREKGILGITREYDASEYNRDTLFRRAAKYIFFPTSFTYEEAIESILSGQRLSTSISSVYCIRLDGPLNKILLMRYQFIIGEYNLKTNSFTLTTNLFNKALKKLNVRITE